MKHIFWIFILFCGSGTLAQSPYKFTNYSADHGLAYNLIDDLVTDKFGYIWLATPNGLSRFNGLEFESISPQIRQTSRSEGGRTNCLKIDNQDQLWVGTESGIFKYDYQSQKFTELLLSNEDDSINNNRDVFAIAFGPENTAWVGTANGLYWIDLVSNKQKYFLPTEDDNSLLDHHIRSLLVDSRGQLWIGGNKGITTYDLDDGLFTKIPINNANPNKGLIGNFIRDIIEDDDGNIWIAAAGPKRGISKYDPESREFFHYMHIDGDEQSIIDNGVFSIEFDDSGKLWAATDGGLEILDTATNVFTHLNHDPLQSNSISLDIIMELIKDEDGRMWLGTFGGLSVWDKYEKNFNSIGTGENLNKKLIHGYVKCLATSVFDGYWIGMDGGGFSFYNTKKSEFDHYQIDSETAINPSSNKVLTLLEDGTQGLWIGYWNSGLDFYDFKTKTYSNFFPDSTSNNALVGRDVFCLFKDSRGQNWVGTWQGLSLMNRNENLITFENFIHDENDPNSLIANTVNSVSEDIINDQLFVGTNKGLSIINLKSGNVINELEGEGGLKMSDIGHVNHMMKDSQNKIWICTASGLVVFDSHKKSFSYVLDKSEEVNLDLQAILEDQNGNFWVSSKNGLNQLYKEGESWQVKHFTKSDGLHGNDFMNTSAIKLNSGQLVFGGLNGITYFDPADIKINNIVPQVVLERIDLFDESTFDGESFPFQTSYLIEEDKVVLPAKASMFTIQFVALNFTDPEKTKYKYRMGGFQDSWYDVNSGRSVSFTNLDPGDYTFRVIACNNDGVWNMEGDDISIEVLPPWWKTNTAYSLFVFSSILLFISIIQLRTRSLRKSRKKLIAEVEKRTYQLKKKNEKLDSTNYLLDEKVKEIETQNEEIVAQLEDILKKNDFIAKQNIEISEKNELLGKAYDEREKTNDQLRQLNANLEEIVEERTANLKSTFDKLQKTSSELNTFLYRSSHDLKGPITTLIGLAMLAKKEFNNAEVLKFFDLVEGTSDAMLRNLRKLQQVHYVFTKESSLDLISFEEVKTSLLNHLNKIENSDMVNKEIDFKNPLNIDFNFDQDLLMIMLENIAENAIFYQRDSDPYLKIELAISGENLEVVIEDNGLGIDSVEGDNMFDMFYRGKELSKGAGLGLYIARSVVNKLNGEISYTSKNGITQFLVTFKL